VIRHIVFFSVKDSHDLDTIEAALKRLGDIPESSHFEVKRNRKSDPLSQEIDLVVYGEFPDAAALERYKKHALYHDAIRIVRPLRDIRIAADVEVF
jgi:hypothetical protein